VGSGQEGVVAQCDMPAPIYPLHDDRDEMLCSFTMESTQWGLQSERPSLLRPVANSMFGVVHFTC